MAKVALHQALEAFDAVHAAATDSPCTHFKSDWFEVVSLPKLHHGMVAPKIVSVGTTVVKSGEILELEGCQGKLIQRDPFNFVVSADEAHISIDILIESVQYGANIQAPC